MKIYEEKNIAASVDALVEIWEDSVRATHHFLSDDEIMQIKKYVPQAIASAEHLIVARDEAEKPVGFMGTDGKILEMLFISPQNRAKGIGKQMVRRGVEDYGISEVTVNEQNPQAVGFYEHMGFETYKRTEFDEQGNPYPLLYMRLKK